MKTAAIFMFTAVQTSDRTILNFMNSRPPELHYEVQARERRPSGYQTDIQYKYIGV